LPVAPSSPPQATAGEVALPEVASSPDAAAALLGSASGEGPSADADGAGQHPSGGAPATTGTTGPAGVGPAGAASAPAAVPDVDAAPRPDLSVGSQVARQVAVLRGGPDGAHSMTLVLTPETLGPVEVHVTVTKGSVELALRGASEQGRAALLDGLPDLRRDLEAAGLSCSRLEVDRETGGSMLDRQPAQQQTSGERSGQHDRGENRSRPWGRPADSGGSGASGPQNRSTSSGVDVLV
ncbi:MAG: flagellar hook-length control protein FliK, partial [Actinomycetes bacterium]